MVLARSRSLLVLECTICIIAVAQCFRMYKLHLGKKRAKVLYELSCYAKEKPMDSIDPFSFEVIAVGTDELNA